jgi:uncharacterized membrane protein YwzB
MCICSTYVAVLGFNLGKFVVNSDGHELNECLILANLVVVMALT